MIKQKKGEITDMLVWVVTIFALGIGLFIIMMVIPQISSGLRVAGLNSSVEGANAIDSLDTISTDVINYGYMFLFFGLIASLMITSFLVRTHPIFVFLYLFILAITILLAAYLGNAYYQMIQNPVLAANVTNATFINMVLSHIVEITLAAGALSIIILFSKFASYGNPESF